MIYGVKRTKYLGLVPYPHQWVCFESTHPASRVASVWCNDVPTPTSSLATAQQALALCDPEWGAEIVKLIIHWRKP